jgi:hypothetical protein
MHSHKAMLSWSAEFSVLGITALSAVVLLLVKSIYLSKETVVKIKLPLSMSEDTAAVILNLST